MHSQRVLCSHCFVVRARACLPYLPYPARPLFVTVCGWSVYTFIGRPTLVLGEISSCYPCTGCGQCRSSRGSPEYTSAVFFFFCHFLASSLGVLVFASPHWPRGRGGTATTALVSHIQLMSAAFRQPPANHRLFYGPATVIGCRGRACVVVGNIPPPSSSRMISRCDPSFSPSPTHDYCCNFCATGFSVSCL